MSLSILLLSTFRLTSIFLMLLLICLIAGEWSISKLVIWEKNEPYLRSVFCQMFTHSQMLSLINTPGVYWILVFHLLVLSLSLISACSVGLSALYQWEYLPGSVYCLTVNLIFNFSKMCSLSLHCYFTMKL